MTNLNSVLVAHITGSFGIASGIFFLLYCLEKPIYSQVLKKNAGAVDSDTQMRRVLVVLQQFLTFRVPFVMGILIIGAMLSCLLRLGLYGFAPLPVFIIISSILIIATTLVFGQPAIKRFQNVSPEASPNEIQTALTPIVRVHRNFGMFVAVILIIQVGSLFF